MQLGIVTNRERCIKTLLCEPTNRPPFVYWLGFAPWGETHARWKRESGIGDLDVARYFDFDYFSQSVPAELGPLPHVSSRVIEETSEFVVTTDWRGITVRNRRDGHSIPEFIAHPIRTPDDWERYKAERLLPRVVERLPGLDEFVAAAPAVDAMVQIGGFPWGVFGTARDMLGTEEVLLAFYDQPDLVRDIMRTFTDVWLAVYERVASRVQVDHLHIWEDMSGKQGSLISMDMIEEFMMPEYDRLADFARQHGIPIVSVDSDGLVDELVPKFMAHGVNALLPFEVQAGNDIETYRRLYPKLGILGGLDKNVLAKDRAALHRELDRAERMMAAGGYVPGFDHLIPPDVPWSNFKYFVEHLRGMIRGGRRSPFVLVPG